MVKNEAQFGATSHDALRDNHFCEAQSLSLPLPAAPGHATLVKKVAIEAALRAGEWGAEALRSEELRPRCVGAKL